MFMEIKSETEKMVTSCCSSSLASVYIMRDSLLKDRSLRRYMHEMSFRQSWGWDNINGRSTKSNKFICFQITDFREKITFLSFLNQMHRWPSHSKPLYNHCSGYLKAAYTSKNNVQRKRFARGKCPISQFLTRGVLFSGKGMICERFDLILYRQFQHFPEVFIYFLNVSR